MIATIITTDKRRFAFGKAEIAEPSNLQAAARRPFLLEGRKNEWADEEIRIDGFSDPCDVGKGH